MGEVEAEGRGGKGRGTYFKRHPRLHLIAQNTRDALVEVLHDAHGELGLDAAGAY